MVNKRKKRIYCIISISDKRLSSFLISLISTLSFYSFLLFFPTFFVLILSYLSGTCTFIFADISGRAELSSWTFQSGTYFPGRGGGCTCTRCTPPSPCVRARVSSKCLYIIPLISIAVSGVIIVACYIKIYQTIRQHNTAAAPSSQWEHSSYEVEEAKITRMLTVVVVRFYLCWLHIKYGSVFYFLPLFVSSVIYPVVYGTMSQSFRNEFLKILRRQP